MQLGGNEKRKGSVFRPLVGPKSKPTSSMLKQNITRYVCSRAIFILFENCHFILYHVLSAKVGDYIDRFFLLVLELYVYVV